ncbi:MAG: glutathione peroxidase [Lachnospiraceae bacterium]|nr:glutathione peroxidase [Lachnospiraceae bacterium]
MKNIDGLAFSGLADPVAKADNIREICGHHNIEFYSVSGGNHSLETGNVQADIKNLSWIISNVDDYVTGLDKTVYDYEVETRGGGLEKLSDHRGRVLLIVNTATGCGFTPQYRALEELYERYSKDGFEILDFPCNQFMNQAPGTSEEIYSFCTSRYAISFPQYAKIHVNGDGQSKLFEYLKSRKGFTGFDTSTQDGRFLDRKLKETDPDYANNSDIKWNFTKFLVDRRGHVVERYEPTTDISVIEGDVRRCLDD